MGAADMNAAAEVPIGTLTVDRYGNVSALTSGGIGAEALDRLARAAAGAQYAARNGQPGPTGPMVAKLEELEARAGRVTRAIEDVQTAALLTDQDNRCRYCGVQAGTRHSSDCRVRELVDAAAALEATLE